MAKYDPKSIPEANMGLLISEFWKAVTLVHNYEEAKIFLRDLLSPQETAMLARRLQIAKMLVEDYPYEIISPTLKVGTGTVARVARWLNYGRGGYQPIIERLIELDNQRLAIKQYDPYDMEVIKKKYAMYYWPEELIGELDSKIRDYLTISRKTKSIPK